MVLNRLFGRSGFWDENLPAAGDWAPAVDIFENEHAFTVKAELPGVDAKDVAVTLDNNVLTLKGERHTDKEVKKENYHRAERFFGSFTRSFALPALVEAADVKAEFKNGLLTITVPKNERAKTRAIEVKAA